MDGRVNPCEPTDGPTSGWRQRSVVVVVVVAVVVGCIICLSVCLSAYRSIYRSIYLAIYISLSLSLSISLSLYLSLSLSFSLSLSLYVYLSLSIYLSICKVPWHFNGSPTYPPITLSSTIFSYPLISLCDVVRLCPYFGSLTSRLPSTNYPTSIVSVCISATGAAPPSWHWAPGVRRGPGWCRGVIPTILIGIYRIYSSIILGVPMCPTSS